MRVPRAIIPGAASPGEVLELSAREANHLVRVLRRKAGDPVRLVSTAGEIFEAEVFEVEEAPRLLVRVKVTSLAGEEPPSILPWTLGLALVKAEPFELALRMASELGILRVVPLVTDRCVVRPEDGLRALERKAGRWRRISEEAAKQCGRAEPLQVAGAGKLDAFLEDCAAGAKWIAVPSGPVRLNAVAGGVAAALESAFLVGPEGGFTPAEVSRALGAGFEPLGLPTPVLRTPTAVALIAALGALALGQ